MLVGRDRLVRELAADPVGLLGEDDAAPEPRRGERRRARAQPSADDRDVRTKHFHVSTRTPQCGRGDVSRIWRRASAISSMVSVHFEANHRAYDAEPRASARSLELATQRRVTLVTRYHDLVRSWPSEAITNLRRKARLRAVLHATSATGGSPEEPAGHEIYHLRRRIAEAPAPGSGPTHRVVGQPRGDPGRHRLWTLHVQQVADALDRAVFDPWKPGVEQRRGCPRTSGSVSVPSTESTG